MIFQNVAWPALPGRAHCRADINGAGSTEGEFSPSGEGLAAEKGDLQWTLVYEEDSYKVSFSLNSFRVPQ